MNLPPSQNLSLCALSMGQGSWLFEWDRYIETIGHSLVFRVYGHEVVNLATTPRAQEAWTSSTTRGSWTLSRHLCARTPRGLLERRPLYFCGDPADSFYFIAFSFRNPNLSFSRYHVGKVSIDA